MNWARALPPPVSTIESRESTQSWVSAGARSGGWRLNSPYWSNIVGAQCRGGGPRVGQRGLRPRPPRRARPPPPHPAARGAVIEVAAAVVNHPIADGHATPDMPAGCGLPGVVKDGRLKTAANIDASWIEAPAQNLPPDRPP